MFQGKLAIASQIANLVRRAGSVSIEVLQAFADEALDEAMGGAMGGSAGATPLRGPDACAAPATPGGAIARQSLSPSVRPHAPLSGPREVAK
jgi:hypothetical protein